MSDPTDPRRTPGDETAPETAAAPQGNVFDASIAGAGTPAEVPTESPSPSVRDERMTVRVRRSPKLGRFALAGGVLGVVVALVLTFAFPEDGEFSAGQVFGFLALFGVVVFGTLGAVVALIVERVSRSRAREVEAEHQTSTGQPSDD